MRFCRIWDEKHYQWWPENESGLDKDHVTNMNSGFKLHQLILGGIAQIAFLHHSSTFVSFYQAS